MEQEIIKQQQESIKLSKMSKGYQWEIRVFLDGAVDSACVERLDKIDKELTRRYGDNGN